MTAPAAPTPAAQPYAGHEILSGFLARLGDLGIAARVEDDPVCGQSVADLALGGRSLCRIEFSATAQRYTLNAMPVDRSDPTLLANVTGRTCEPEAAYRTHQLDVVEALLRAAVVREGAMAERDFPTDYALKRWVAAASTLRLPQERSPRRYRTEDIAFRPGELPHDDLRVATPAAKSIVQATRLLDVGYDRDRALDVAWATAALSVERDAAGRPADRVQAYLVQSARVLVRGRRRDMDLAWDRSGLDRVLAQHGHERDDMRVPLSLSEAEHAPRLF